MSRKSKLSVFLATFAAAFLVPALAFAQQAAAANKFDSNNGLAIAAGFGWEIAVRRGYSVVPFAQVVHGPATGLSLNDTRITDGATIKLVQLGLGLGVGR